MSVKRIGEVQAKASVQVIPPAKLDEIRPLLAAPPSGDYYEVIE